MSDTNARVGVTIGTKAETTAVDRYTASVQRMQGAIKSLFASGDAAKAGAAFGGSFAAAGLSVQSMVGKITEAISGSSELASEMALVERRVGLTGEAFQVLSRSGKAASEELISSLAKYRVKLGEALAGDKDARKLFGGLGLSPEELTKLPVERQLEALGASLGRLGDRNRQAAEAQAFFGKGYTAMIPVLDKLRTEGYDKLRDKVAETAGVLSGEMSSALSKAKKEANEASAALATALAPTNLRLLKIKAQITGALADNAGTIQSAGSGLGTGFLTAAVLGSVVKSLGPQLNVIGSQSALAFNKGFGVGAALLPSIVVGALTSPGALSGFAGVGRMLATPMGAAIAVALGAFVINELERIALEQQEKIDRINERGVAEFRSLRDGVKAAATPEAATAALHATEKALFDRKAELAKLEREAEAYRLEQVAAVAAARTGGRPAQPRSLSEEQLAQKEALTKEIELLKTLVKYSVARGAADAAANAARQSGIDQALAEEAELLKMQGKRESLLDRERQNNFAALTDDASRLEFLQRIRVEDEAAFDARIAQVRNDDLAAEMELEQRVKIAEVDAKIAQLRKKIADETAASARAAEEEMAKILTQLDREWRKDITRGLDTELHQIGIARAKAEGDFVKTAAEKWQARQIAISDDMAATTRALTALENRRAANQNLGVSTEGVDAEIQRAKDRLDELQMAHLQAGPNPNNWVEQTAASLTQLRDQWGTTAQQIGDTISGTIGTAVNSVADNITNALLVTGDWGQALDNIGLTIGTEIVRSIIAMGARWVATQIMMAVAGKALAAASLAATTPIALAQSAVWAGPATLSTIATMGASAAAAPTEIAGSIGLTQMLAMMPGFAEGGWTGGREGEVAGAVHGKEFVWSAPAVRAAGGPEVLDAAHRALLSPAPTASGPLGIGGGETQKEVRHLWVEEGNRGLARQLASDPNFRNIVHKIVRDSRGDFGVQL